MITKACLIFINFDITPKTSVNEVGFSRPKKLEERRSLSTVTNELAHLIFTLFPASPLEKILEEGRK